MKRNEADLPPTLLAPVLVAPAILSMRPAATGALLASVSVPRAVLTSYDPQRYPLRAGPPSRSRHSYGRYRFDFLRVSIRRLGVFWGRSELARERGEAVEEVPVTIVHSILFPFPFPSFTRCLDTITRVLGSKPSCESCKYNSLREHRLPPPPSHHTSLPTQACLRPTSSSR